MAPLWPFTFDLFLRWAPQGPLGPLVYFTYKFTHTNLAQTIKNKPMFQSEIECYYDGENNVVYLHLSSLHDSFRLAAVCDKLSKASDKVQWYQTEIVHVV